MIEDTVYSAAARRKNHPWRTVCSLAVCEPLSSESLHGITFALTVFTVRVLWDTRDQFGMTNSGKRAAEERERK